MAHPTVDRKGPEQLLEVVAERAAHLDPTKIKSAPILGIRGEWFRRRGEPGLALGDEALLPVQALELPGAETEQHEELGQNGQRRPEPGPKATCGARGDGHA